MTEDTQRTYCINYGDVEAAARRIQGRAHYTPVMTSSSIDDIAGRKLFFKVEALQRTGSFKFRGALNATQFVLSDPETLNSNTNDSYLSTVTHSSGNHAQALALAAKVSSDNNTKITSTIVMPNNTPLVKKAAVEAFGGNIVMSDNTPEAREAEADRVLAENGGGTLRRVC